MHNAKAYSAATATSPLASTTIPRREVIPIQKVNEAYERLLKSDVKYRFSMDMASLKADTRRGQDRSDGLPPQPRDQRALYVGQADARILDAATRLVELMAQPVRRPSCSRRS